MLISLYGKSQYVPAFPYNRDRSTCLLDVIAPVMYVHNIYYMR